MNIPDPSAREIDALFAMRPVSSAADAEVQRALGEARNALVVEPSPAFVVSFAARLAAVSTSEPAAARSTRQTHKPRTASARSPWMRRATAAVAVAVTSAGLVAGAAAANQAAPGAPLYGADRALERVGILDGGIEERLDEAQVLADGGKSDQAFRHAAEALEDGGYPDAARALERSEAALGAGLDPDDVAAFVDWLRVQDRGPGFGVGVAERATSLVEAPDEARAHGSTAQAPASTPPAEPGTQGKPPVVPATPAPQGAPPAEPGKQGKPPVVPATPAPQGAPPAEPEGQGNPPAEPGAQGKPSSAPVPQGKPSSAPVPQGAAPADKGKPSSAPVPQGAAPADKGKP